MGQIIVNRILTLMRNFSFNAETIGASCEVVNAHAGMILLKNAATSPETNRKVSSRKRKPKLVLERA